MEKLTVGSVVLVIFPFSNLKGRKVRPALVLAGVEFNDFILCQITSRSYSSKLAIVLEKTDFVKGSLPLTSYVRPDKLFTADLTIIKRKAGELKPRKRKTILGRVQKLFIE